MSGLMKTILNLVNEQETTDEEPFPFTKELREQYEQKFLELISATGLTPFMFEFVGSSEINQEIGADVDILMYVSPDVKFDLELINRASDNDLFFTGEYTLEDGEPKENGKVEQSFSVPETGFLSFKYEGYVYPFPTYPLNVIVTKSIDDYRRFVFARNVCQLIQESPYNVKLTKAQRVCIHEIIRNNYEPNLEMKQ